MTSGKVDINGYPIWYEKFGNGPNILLLIPGAIGTGRTDFLPQLEGKYAFDQTKYTIVAIELPGWGRSRPPERRFDKKVYLNDAITCIKLMDTLGYKESYSVIGWSEGAKVALVMVRYSTKIKCLVIMSIFMRATPQTIQPILGTQDIKTWTEEMRDNYVPILGDQVQPLWDGYINFKKAYCSIFGNGYWTEDLDSISCPTLIFHGDLDPLIPPEHPLYVEKQIRNSVLYRFKKGGHNCHQKYPSDFKRIVETFFAQNIDRNV